MWEFLQTQSSNCFMYYLFYLLCVPLVGFVAVVEVNIVYKAVRTIADLASTLMDHETLCPGNRTWINYINYSIGQCQRNIVYCPCQFQSIQLYEDKMFELVQSVMPLADDS